MAQNREAPAYQEYAAAMMARREYRVMSLAARGLLFSLRLECWVNRTVPASPAMLARVLGYPHDEIEAVLAEVAPFLDRDAENFVMPDLEDYRAHIAGIREKQAAGGKRGAEKTNSMRSGGPTGCSAGNPSGNSRDTRRVTVESVDQFKPDQTSQVQQPPSHEESAVLCGQGGDDEF